MNEGDQMNPGVNQHLATSRDLVSRFGEIATAYADSVAVIEASMSPGQPDAAYTYGELNKRRLEIASLLVDEHQVEPGDRVGLMQARRFETLAAMLGIATLGACYVPLDSDLPAARQSFVMQDSNIRLLLSAEPQAQRQAAPGAIPIKNLRNKDIGNGPATRNAAESDSSLYIMYTSGSTGTPKGVVIPHRAVHRLVVATDFMTLDRHTRFLHFAPQSFDAATLEIWGPLLNGGTCVLCPDGVFDPNSLEALVSKHSINAMWLTAALFNQVVDQGSATLGQLDTLLFGGERASVPHVRRAQRLWPETTLINGYGPTENTTFTCCHRVCRRDVDEQYREIPIGKAIAGTTIRVVDENLAEVPTGIRGELLTGGEGLAHEYLNQAELTATRFILDSDGERWYRTGDLVSADDEGVIHFHGRADRQLKVHGHRIEPGEVEAALLADARIRNAHVRSVKTPQDDQKLVAYLVGTFDRGALRERLARALPRYMVPSVFVGMDALPTTKNGKIDTAALPDPFSGSDTTPAAVTGDDMTRLVAATWQNVVSGIALESFDDNFFDVGGTSMDMMLVRQALERQLATSIPLVTLFQYPTVSKLADYLDTIGKPEFAADSVRDRAAQRRKQLARRKAGRAR